MVLGLNPITDDILNLPDVGCWGLLAPQVWVPMKSPKGLAMEGSSVIKKIKNKIKGHGYLQSQTGHTMFCKHLNDGRIAILIVYVDDIILTRDHVNELEKLKAFLAKEFETKDLGVLKYFLDMEFTRSKKGIFVIHRKYVLDMLSKTGLLGCKPIETLMELNLKLQAVSA